MADSMLSDLPSASAINDTDLLYAVVDGISKKITKQVLFNAVTQVLSTKADLVQGVLALAQTREMLTQVLNDTARFALTTSDVKNGFIIIVQQDEHGVPYSPNPKMYIVVDATKLDEEAGYQAFASDVDWSTIENKPDNIVFSGPALATEDVPAIDAYLHKSDVVDNFTDGGTDVPLSAECGKLLNSTLNQTLKATGLSYTNCTYVHGGYVEIGNLVVVNIRVKADSTAASASIGGFPAYTSSQGTRVPVTIYCASNETFSKISYLFTNGDIILGSVSLNNTYAISAVYIKG